MASEAVLSVIWTKKLYGLAFFQRRVDSRAGYQDEWGQDHIGHGGGQVSGQNSCIVGFLFIISPPPVRSIREELRNEVTAMSKQLADFVPGLRIVQVGGREDSNVYIRMKIKAATEIGIDAAHVQLPRSITEVELLDKVSLRRKRIMQYGQYNVISTEKRNILYLNKVINNN